MTYALDLIPTLVQWEIKTVSLKLIGGLTLKTGD